MMFDIWHGFVLGLFRHVRACRVCICPKVSKNRSSVFRMNFLTYDSKLQISYSFFICRASSVNTLLIISYPVSCCKVVACLLSYSWGLFRSYGLTRAVVSLQVIQAVFFGICVLTDLSSLLTRGSGNQEQERQLKKLISLRDWMLAVLAFPVGVVSMMYNAFNHKRNLKGLISDF